MEYKKTKVLRHFYKKCLKWFKLICALVGEESIVVVDIQKNQLVGDLKEAIKKEQNYGFPADNLKLYVANKDGDFNSKEFLSDDENGDYGQLSQNPISSDMSEKYLKRSLIMKATKDIEYYFL